MSISNETVHFLDYGIQYYSMARAAFWTQFGSAGGNAFHHAIEMLLKAELSKGHSLSVLSKRPFSHDLPHLWTEFKEAASPLTISVCLTRRSRTSTHSS